MLRSSSKSFKPTFALMRKANFICPGLKFWAMFSLTGGFTWHLVFYCLEPLLIKWSMRTFNLQRSRIEHAQNRHSVFLLNLPRYIHVPENGDCCGFRGLEVVEIYGLMCIWTVQTSSRAAKYYVRCIIYWGLNCTVFMFLFQKEFPANFW